MKRLVALIALALAFVVRCDAQTITTSFLQVTTPTCASSAFQNVPFSCQIVPTGGIPPYSYTLNSGGGSGLSMSTGANAGLISGTPTGTSLVNFNITVTDSGNSSQTSTIGVTPGSLSSITVTPTNTGIKTSNTLQMAATGNFSNGVTSLTSLATWSCTGAGPCGSVSSSGLFTAGGSGGTATIKAVFNSITDDGGAGVAVTVSSTVPVFNTSSLCSGQIYQTYGTACTAGGGQQLSCSGGTPPYTFALGTLVLQKGLGISSAGVISGTPSASGTNSGTITCTDNLSNVGTSPSLSLAIASVSSLTVALSPSTITFPQTSQATATGTYSDSSVAVLPNNAISWTSGTTTCATVNASGVVTALNVSSNCTSVITATVGSVSNTATVSVNASSTASASRTQNSRVDSCTSGSTTCTIASLNATTTAGTALICYVNAIGATSISSCTDGGDTFSTCVTLGGTTCTASQGSIGSDMRAILSGAGGKTSLTCNVTVAPTNAWTCGLLEFATTGTGFSFDASGNVSDGSSGTSQAGVGLTLSGTNDIIVQNANNTHTITAVSSGYALNGDSNGNAESFALNTSSGTAPTFTINNSATAAVGAIALKQPGSGGGGGGGGGATYTAASCSLSAVQAIIATEQASKADGDIISIPSCAATTWSAALNQTFTNSVTIQGQSTTSGTCAPGGSCTATDNTNITVTGQGNGTIQFGTTAGKSFRLTGISFTFTGTRAGFGTVNIVGSSTAVRVDHNHINDQIGGDHTFQTDQINGVFDHNIFDSTTSANLFFAELTNKGTSGVGNEAWAQPEGFGGSNFVFFENNLFQNGTFALDCEYGGRFVFRFNTTGTNTRLQNHGTTDLSNAGGPQNFRGCRTMEVYQNTFTFTSTPNTNEFAFLMDYESGTGMWWGNTVTGFVIFLREDVVRSNSQTYTESATPAGYGYCGSSAIGGVPGPSPWDGNVSNGNPCLDGIGRGQGQLLVGAFPNTINQTTGTVAWPNQNLVPVYAWNNTVNVSSFAPGKYWQNFDAVSVENRDYYLQLPNINETATFTGAAGIGQGLASARPGTCTPFVAWWATDQNTLFQCSATNTWNLTYYTPFQYPHPLDH